MLDLLQVKIPGYVKSVKHDNYEVKLGPKTGHFVGF